MNLRKSFSRLAFQVLYKMKSLKKSFLVYFVYHLVWHRKIVSRDYWLLQYYSRLFDIREVDYLQTIKSEPCVECNSVASFWRIYKKIHYYAEQPQGITLLRGFVDSYDGSEDALKYMESAIITLMLRHSSALEFIEFMKSVKSFSFKDKGSFDLKVRYIKTLESRWKSYKKELNSIFDINKDLGAIERLRVAVECRLKDENGVDIFDNYLSIENEFLTLVNDKLRRDYLEMVVTRYNMIREQVTLLDIERQSSQRDRFFELIQTHLSTGKGLSFIRLSEGEAYLCTDYSQYFTSDDIRNRERHWWGQELPLSLRQKIVADGVSVIKNADIIGIPSIYRFLVELKVDSDTLLSRFQGRGLAAVLEAVTHLNTKNKIYTDALVNRFIFKSVNDMVQLGKSAKKIVIVASVKTDVMREIFPSEFLFQHVSIPTHFKTSMTDGYESSGKILPFIYEDKCKELRTLCSSGTLVYVAAGVAGKVFIDVAKQCGAVGLDVGHAINGFVQSSK